MDVEKGDEHSHEIILELLLNYPGYLTGTFYLGVPLVSVVACLYGSLWVTFLVA